ncbi:MAG TPA: PrsW family glutamic-type intramembrane protease [Acidimicrobiales bacterium]|nr:PrsW family glutamic-type intramembrane protease [Acidimicrobiales bacterium]
MDIRTEALIAAFVPSLAWLALVYSRDRYEKEPKWLVARLYVMSIIAVVLAFALESATRPRLSGAVGVVLGGGLLVGLIEEGSKFSVLVLGTRRNTNLNEPVDGMIYASAVALGFAGVETLSYILRTYDVALAYHLSPSTASHLALTMTAPVRALVGNLGHMAWTGIIGYEYGRWRCGLGSRRAVAVAYVVGACGHGAYDALLGLDAPALAYSVLAMGVLVYAVLFHRALAASPFRHHQLRAVPALSIPPAPGSSSGVVPLSVAPPGGLAVWARPDPGSHLVGQLPPGLPVQVVARLGAWAHVLTSSGWSGWVDGRALRPAAPDGAGPSS